MESMNEDSSAKKTPYTTLDGVRYWHSYEEAKLHPESGSDGRVFRWVGTQWNTFVELRT